MSQAINLCFVSQVKKLRMLQTAMIEGLIDKGEYEEAEQTILRRGTNVQRQNGIDGLRKVRTFRQVQEAVV